MFKPQRTIKHRLLSQNITHQHDQLEFGLLCWNAHKKTNTATFDQYLSYLQATHPTDVLLLQEAHEPNNENYLTENFETLFAPNLQMKRRSYGLLTASNISHRNAKCLLSNHQELFFKTHKSTLISHYEVSPETHLIIANIHALNFRRAYAYQAEINTLITHLESHDGPLIIAGDFNAWSKKRETILYDLIESLELDHVEFNNSQHIKRFRRRPLDHIFYRNLKLVDAEALNTGKLSDHNPLYARFCFA